ncbi:MAG: bifunctional orotidine-5'-phosphate decarboxylase/orotate phosphoribosyltransferase [Microcoleaceae cyanobacterium]
MTFSDKLLAATEQNQSLLSVSLGPTPELQSSTQPSFHQWREQLERIISATANLVCAYKIPLGFYQIGGANGWELLKEILRLIPDYIPTIADIKYSDLNTSSLFAEFIFQDLQFDACTVSPYAGRDLVNPFLLYPGKAVFILCATANPSATFLQEYPNYQYPLYLKLVQETQIWGTPEQLGLQAGLMPDILARIRQTAPERWILLEGDIAEENDLMDDADLSQILSSGLDQTASGLIVPLPPQMLLEKQINATVKDFRNRVNQHRQQLIKTGATCDLWLPNICFIKPQPHRDLILQLYDIGCIIFGDHVQASGETFPYYIDLRRIISIPQIFHQIVEAYTKILKQLTFDRIAGIPYGSLPTATGLALKLEKPMIFPRKEAKQHGTGRLIEGHFQPGETIVVVDDILITGSSVIKGAGKLESVGLKVKDIVVLIDHGNNVMEKLGKEGYQGHAVLNLVEIAETLYEANRIESQQRQFLVNESSTSE